MAKNENIDLTLNMSVDDSLKSVRTMQLEIKKLKEIEMEFETARNKATLAGDSIAATAHQNKIKQIKEQRANLMGAREDAAAAERMLDTGNLVSQFSKMSQAGVASFAAVTGAMKMMGMENETAKALNESAAVALQVMIGFEQVHALLIDGKARAENAAAIKRAAIWVKDIAMKGADIAATVGLTVATGAMTAAQWLLNIAMSANPIGLIVLGVAGLIAGFLALYKATGSLTEAMMWLVNPLGMVVKLLYDNYQAEQLNNEEKKKSVAAAEAQVKIQEKVVEQVKKEIAAAEKKLEKMKRQGATEAELWAQTEIILNKKIVLAKEEEKLAEKNFIASAKRGDIAFSDMKRLYEAKKGIIDAEKNKADEVEKKNDERIAENRRKGEEAYKKRIEDEKAYQKKIEDIKIDAIKNDTIRQIEKLKLDSKREIDSLNKSARNYAELKLDIENKLSKDIQQVKDDAEKKEQETIDKDTADRKTRMAEYLKEQEEAAKKEKEIAEQKLKDSKEIDKQILEGKSKSGDLKAGLDLIKQNNKEELDDLKKLYDDKTISLDQYLKRKQQLLNDQAIAEEDLILKEKEKEIQNYTDKIDVVAGTLNQINDLLNQASQTKMDNIDIEYTDEQEKLQQQLDNKLITQEQFDLKSEELEKSKNEKLRVEKEKAWKRQHLVDMANIVMQGISATMSAYVAGLSVGGPLAPVTAAIYAGIAGSFAAVQLGIVASQKMPKFAKGGMINGAPHAAGGVLLEAEGGEAIINKNTMANPGFASVISALNVAGGGAPLIKSGSLSSNQSAPVVASVDNAAIAQAVIVAIKSIPVNVVESDITSTQKKVNTIESRSVIG